MRRMLLIGCCAALLAGLAACEQPQTVTTRKTDAKPWQGADNAYLASGWKAGDRGSWEEQMRARAQTQNDYNKTK
ncbi:MAG TPA: hypothetical protein VF169_05710 [Albitalea sp.]|uniref:hypothetical protein n=1 Tax=Piscinibacter sp. TaxID=1903157 RepID=UPI002ED042D0